MTPEQQQALQQLEAARQQGYGQISGIGNAGLREGLLQRINDEYKTNKLNILDPNFTFDNPINLEGLSSNWSNLADRAYELNMAEVKARNDLRAAEAAAYGKIGRIGNAGLREGLNTKIVNQVREGNQKIKDVFGDYTNQFVNTINPTYKPAEITAPPATAKGAMPTTMFNNSVIPEMMPSQSLQSMAARSASPQQLQAVAAQGQNRPQMMISNYGQTRPQTALPQPTQGGAPAGFKSFIKEYNIPRPSNANQAQQIYQLWQRIYGGGQ